jgi:cytochrome c-type biogenesis protein CcmH
LRRLAAATLAVIAALAVAAPALAAAACPRTTLGDVEHEVMCLECGVPLDVAENSLQARQERTFISRQIAACRTKDQVKDALAAQYGDRVLATPKPSGIGLAAYLVPIAALLVGLAAIGYGVTRWRRRTAAAEPTAPSPPPADPRDAARLEADLTRYDL